jgi:hypothetical protein
MFDLGRTFLAAVERSPEALAIVDGSGGSATRRGIVRLAVWRAGWLPSA